MTRVELANLALSFIGDTRIASFSDETEIARLVNAHFDMALLTVLESKPWRLAETEQLLTEITDSGESTGTDEFDYRYQLPTDPFCVTPLFINGDRDRALYQFTVATIVGSTGVVRRTLLTDEKPVTLHYTYYSKDPSVWTAHFGRAVATRLAADLCIQVGASETKKQGLEQLYEIDLRRAWAQDSRLASRRILTRDSRYKTARTA